MSVATATMPQAWVEGGQVWLRIGAKDQVAEIKELGFPHSRDGAWRFAPESAANVSAYATRHGIPVSPELAQLAITVAAEPKVKISRSVIHVIHEKNGPSLTGVVPTAMHRSDKSKKYWTVPLADSAAVVAWADSVGYPVDPAVRADAASRWEAELEAFALSTSTRTDTPLALTGALSKLMPLQEVAVLALQKYRLLLIADEPGLGKTLESLAALRVTGREVARAIVICPSSLTANWVAETGTHFEFGSFTPFIAEGMTPGEIPEGTDLAIVGWAVVGAWAEVLEKWKAGAIIIDEGHYAKSGAQTTRVKKTVTKQQDGTLKFGKELKKTGGTARASGAITIAKSVARSKNGMVAVLSGTPIVNRPNELLALLEMLTVDLAFGGPVAFKERYCGPESRFIGAGKGPNRDGYITTYDGASNLAELNTRLRSSGHYLRRTKKFMVEQGTLPPKYVDGVEYYDYEGTRKPWVIAPTPEVMAPYLQVERETSAFFADRARELASKMGVGAQTQKVEQSLRKEAAKHLQRIAFLRQAAAKVKSGAITERALALVARGEKVVIAAHHRDVVDLFAETFSGLRIQGGMSTAEVEEHKRLFNGTPVEMHPVMVVSIEAGKTGHTLCRQSVLGVGLACSQMILAEQIWTPGDEIQMQDRIWRIGQDRPVHITNALLKNSIDLSIYGARERKRIITLAAIDAVETESENEGAVALALALAQRGLQQGWSEAGQVAPSVRG